MSPKKSFYGISVLAASIRLLENPLTIDSSGNISLANSVTLPAIQDAIASYANVMPGKDIDVMSGANGLIIQAYDKDADSALRSFVRETIEGPVELSGDSVFVTRGTVRQAKIGKSDFDTAILVAAKQLELGDVSTLKANMDPNRWQTLMRSFHPATGEAQNLRLAA